MLEVNDATFEDEVINNNGVVVVDYFAEWCAPCKNLMPRVESVNDQSEDVKFVKVNIDNNLESSLRNSVRTIPTLIVYKDGQVVNEARGCSKLSESELKELVNV